MSKLLITVILYSRRIWKLKNKDDATYSEAKAYTDLLQKAMFLDYTYQHNSELLPYISFYKYLARRPEYCEHD
jgi:hypothetical protein